MNKSGLLFRLAVVVAFSSLAVSFISTQLFYRHTYLNEVDLAHQEIEQLFKTVQATASISAYLGDLELAKEVVNGLQTNDIVLAASISADGKILVPFAKPQSSAIDFDLLSPFQKHKAVGTLSITPNLVYIERNAKNIGQTNSLALVAQAFIVTIIAIYIAYSLITKPMINTAKRLHKIDPGTSDRLQVPDFHDGSELGTLVRDINKLLDKTELHITEERKLRADIEVLEKRFRMLFENSASPIVLTEPLGNILIYNKAFQIMLDRLGVQFKKSYGPLLSELFDSPEQLQKSVRESFANDELATGEYKLKTGNRNKSLWMQVVTTSILSDDMKEYYQVTLHDISNRKKELELLNQRADYDPLTQLMNRNALERKLTDLLGTGTPFALLMMDLDGFKQVNDIYGHDCGDEILLQSAAAIKKSIRRCDLSSRWGGDEFVIVLQQIGQQEVVELCRKLLAKIENPHYLPVYNKEISVSISIGVAFYPDDGQDTHSLVRNADQAMYAVKRGQAKLLDQHLEFSDAVNEKPQGSHEAL